MKRKFFSSFICLQAIMLVNSIYKINELYGFKCYGITKIDTPIRLTSNNEIECLSINGLTCAKNLDNEEKCRQFVKENIYKAKFVRCKNMRIIDKKNVCFKAKNFFFKQWKCYNHTGIRAALRINQKTGKVKCLSFNGKTCVQGNNALNLCKIHTNLKKIPLTCGKNTMKNHRKLCNKAFAWYKFTGDWLCKSKTNINTPIRLGPKGKIECLSRDGVNCIWGVINDNQCRRLANIYTKTVKCKKRLKCNMNRRKYTNNFKSNRRRYNRYFKRQITKKLYRTKGKCAKKRNKNRNRKINGRNGFKSNNNWCRMAKLYIFKNFIDFDGTILRGSPDGHQQFLSNRHSSKWYWRRFKKYIRIIWYIPRSRYRWRVRYSTIWTIRRRYLLWLRWKNRYLNKMRYLWRLRIRLKKRNIWSRRLQYKWRYVWGRYRMRLSNYKRGYNRWKIRMMNSHKFRKGIILFNRFRMRRSFSGRWKRIGWSRRRNNWKWQIGLKLRRKHRYRFRRRIGYLRRKRARFNRKYKSKKRFHIKSRNKNQMISRRIVIRRRRRLRRRSSDDEDGTWRLRNESKLKTSSWR